MKVAFISDLHANFEAVAALSPRLAAADMVVCLGDLLGYYCQVNEVMEWVRDNVSLCVLGNHDSFVLKGCPAGVPPAVRFGVEHAASVLEPDHASWLNKLPLVWGGNVADKSVLLAHGSPWNPLEDYLYADSPNLSRLSDFDFDLVVFGQTHRFFEKRETSRLLLNPGAVGQSRDAATIGHATAAMVDLATMQVTKFVEPYDAAKVLNIARAKGADEWIAKHMMS
jgi:putative phosphoesterase